MITPENISSQFSSDTVEWPTPQYLFDVLNAEFGFTLDPCATPSNAKCKKFYTKEDNGLSQLWDNDIVFMNPPYGREIKTWMQKAYESSKNGATVVCLVPSRTDTKWWHFYAMRGEIRFFKRRLEFVGSNNKAPFASAIVVFRSPDYKVTAC
jgi:phage N-6-adenine-methyltransferase